MKKVSISASGEEVLDRLVASGVGESAEQVVDISLRYLDGHEAKLRALRQDASAAMEEISRGDVITDPGNIEDTKAEFRKRRQQNFSA